jgi:acetyl-CoA carboxylase carboxyl transferase subunit beta
VSTARAAGAAEQAAVLRQWLADVPDGTWIRCPSCAQLAYRQQLRSHRETCPGCGWHARASSDDRIEWLPDEGSFSELDATMAPADPLQFVDSKPYARRIAELRRSGGPAEAARYGTAAIGGHDIVLCLLDFAFQGGSMGSVVGEKVTRAAELAAARRVPLIVYATSGGARMQEGMLSLMQMAKTAAAVGRMREAGVLFVSVLADPVYGGVCASFAMLGDVIIAEPGARIGFAGPKVIEQTIRQRLPAGFQSAEFLLEKGHIDAIVPRPEQRSYLGRLLAIHGARPVPPAPVRPAPAAVPEPPALSPAGPAGDKAGEDAWQTVRLAREPRRPNAGDYIGLLFDSFAELHGDRSHADDAAITGGPALLRGRPVMVIGHRKGRGTQENVARNFGMPHPSGYRKAARLMRYAERFGMPVVTFIDTPGAYPGIRAEEENQSAAIAENLVTMAALRVPVITVVIGEGGSGGALALGVCDRLLMLSNTIYSVISPEGCATILFRDATRAPEAAVSLRLTATGLSRLAIADEVIGEPGEGAHTDHAATADAVGEALTRHLSELSAVAADDLVARRYQRLRACGAFHEGPEGDQK